MAQNKWSLLSRRDRWGAGVLVVVVGGGAVVLWGATTAMEWLVIAAVLLVGLGGAVAARLLVNRMKLLSRRLEQETSAKLYLWSTLAPDSPMPDPGGGATSHELLAVLVDAIVRGGARNVVECGSGASTIWLALALRRSGGGRVTSFEHDSQWYAQVRDWLEASGLSEYADVRFAPLVSTRDRGPWYSIDAFSDLADIDLLFVDGPPGDTTREARYLAFPVVRSALRPGALVVLDDVDRPEEQHIRTAWVEESAGRLSPAAGRSVERAAILRWSDAFEAREPEASR